ncbi:MAG TPA: HD domain-containing phosphohydrolase [Candidatus Polarisedimenticolaceae bacterium]|nr:HD domain-containing phosphohydrolase [Candidatus Polarisedimenticolaceae bacterium]
MIKTVNAAVLEIQGALLARALYPAGHPRIRHSEERAYRLLHEILEKRPEVSLFAVDERVIFDNEILPSSASLVDAMFRMLHMCGVDQITFRRGLREDEVRALLDGLARGDAGVSRQLEPSAHVGLSFLREFGDRPEEQTLGVVPSVLSYAEQAADVLPEVWTGLGDRYKLDSGLLGDIVACLSKVVVDSAGALLPLAPLKRHDEYTFVHTINVAIMSTTMSEALGFDPEQAHELSISALLHDVGKQAVPKEILNKAGRYTEEEFRVMQTHPVEGARILFNTPGVPEISTVVAYEHHVRADGGGYPKVPRGWKLNLASRIVQLADVFDALRTHRPYRPGLPIPKVVEMMKHDIGTFFDADLLQIFFERVISRGLPEAAGAPALSPGAASRPS